MGGVVRSLGSYENSIQSTSYSRSNVKPDELVLLSYLEYVSFSPSSRPTAPVFRAAVFVRQHKMGSLKLQDKRIELAELLVAIVQRCFPDSLSIVMAFRTEHGLQVREL